MSKIISLAIVLAAVAAGGRATLGCGGDKPPPKTPDTAARAPARPRQRLACPTRRPTRRRPARSASPTRSSRPAASARPTRTSPSTRTTCAQDDARVLDAGRQVLLHRPAQGPHAASSSATPTRAAAATTTSTLGQKRADSVAQYILGKGMDKSKTESTSRGAMDATGTDEPTLGARPPRRRHARAMTLLQGVPEAAPRRRRADDQARPRRRSSRTPRGR